MTILCIDPGIHNLSFCILKASDTKDFSTYEIKLWENYDLLEDTDKLCQSIQKNGKVCNKKCSLKYKSKVTEGTEITSVTEETNKIPVIESKFIYTCKLHSPKDPEIKLTEYKRKKIDTYLLRDLVEIFIIKIKDVFNENKELFLELSKIHLELQPSVNAKLKLISHVLFTCLIENYIKENVEIPEIKFVAAKYKLKVNYTGPELICNLKSEYSKRKWMSDQIGNWYLTEKFCQEQKDIWLDTLVGKTNDKYDTLLMAINCLYGIPKVIKTVNSKKPFKKFRKYNKKIK